ncbi:D-alanine--D-alanine ligase [Candidatus Saccharibacteria bacterium]|nr:D-alanine--D-alanine ligase [Candidatus Saccharibacteria bacterium]
MTKVLILQGGTSSEREVSLRSGSSVKNALELAGHEVGVADPGNQDFDLATATRGYDIVFSVLHGTGGEDGVMQAQLDAIGIPYVGSNTVSSELCFDKWRYREKLLEAGFRVARGELVDLESFWQSDLVKQPFVLKPYDGGSSIDTLIQRDPNTLDRQTVEQMFANHSKMLLENLVAGVEITVPVLGDGALPVIEIIPPESGEFDYDNKYNGQSQELCPPLHVNEDVQRHARDMAVQIHTLCGCGGYSRTDMIVSADGSLTVLETNTLPGMTDQSLFPKAAAVAGINMPTLCSQLVQSALTNQTASA